MRGRTTSLLVAALVAPALLASHEGTAPEPCVVDRHVDPAHADHRDWTSEPEGAWRVRQEPTSRWVTLEARADVPTTARLTTDAVLASDGTRLELHHDRLLAPEDGYRLEVSVDGGPFADAGELIVAGGYDGTTSDGRPAFVGPDVAPVDLGSPATVRVTEVDLSRFAGRSVRLALQLHVATGVPGGFVAFHEATWHRVRDADCLDGYASNPWAACLSDRYLQLAPDPHGHAGATPGWRNVALFVTWTSSGAGLDAKDDRLVSEAFAATPRTRVSFAHRWELEDGHDGGRIEYSTDDGTTWTPIPSEWVLVGRYTGELADGGPAWTGTSARHPENVRPNPEWDLASTVDLGALAGQQVRIRHRLLQDAQRTDSTPGLEWSMSGTTAHDVVAEGCRPSSTPIFDVEPEDCLDEVPDHVEPPVLTDDVRHQLDVLVLLDVAEGVELAALRDDADRQDEWQQRWDALVAEMDELLLPSRTGYDRHDVELTLTYRLLDRYWDEGDVRPDALPSAQALQVAKDAVGGIRPEGSDVVYLATDREGFEGSVAGRADCIGGVRYDDAAFAVGAMYRDRGDLGFAGTRWLEDTGAKVLAHEVGHLMGGHHHYANCVEPTQDVVESPVLFARCTTMINDVGLASLRFSTLSGSVVRGYAAHHTDH